MDTVYRAFDGTIFDDNNDCASYERNKRLERYKDTVKTYDEKGNALDIINSDPNDWYRIIFLNKEAKQILLDDSFSLYYFFDDEDYENDYLDFYYDMDEEQWMAVEEKYNQLANRLKKFCEKYGLTKYCG